MFLSAAGNCLWLCSLLISRSELLAPLYLDERKNKKPKNTRKKKQMGLRGDVCGKYCAFKKPDQSFIPSPRSTSTSLWHANKSMRTDSVQVRDKEQEVALLMFSRYLNVFSSVVGPVESCAMWLHYMRQTKVQW